MTQGPQPYVATKVLYFLTAGIYTGGEVIDMTLGENLQRLRKVKGLSQEEVAQKLFLTRQSVSKWENGQAEPGVENLKALSRLYGVSVDELVGNTQESGEEEPCPQPVDLFSLAVTARLLTVLYGIFFVDSGILLYSWDLPVLLAGLRFQNQIIWAATLALGGASLFIHLLVTAKALWYFDIYGEVFSFLIVTGGIALMLVLLIQKKTKQYFCGENMPKE